MLRNQDPFANPLAKLNQGINPYVDLLKSAELQLPLYWGESLRERDWRKEGEKLYVEVGCHFGKTLLEIAKANPNDSIVGLDITFKRVVKAARKIARENLSNASVALLNAKNLSEVFSPKSIDGLVVFFPDPWNKKNKHRLLQPNFLEELDSLLSARGFVWFKTDQEEYFNQVANYLDRTFCRRIPPRWPLTPTTFETLFRSSGQPCFDACWFKTDPLHC